MPSHRICLVLALFLFAACQVPASRQLENMYARISEESTSDKLRQSDLRAAQKNLSRSIERVNEIVEKGELSSPRDAYYAAFILYESPRLEDVLQAQELALNAFEGGEEDAIRVAAHCMDRSLVMSERPQRFGTQLVYEPVISKWRLWDVDPSTTDEERAAFGLPPLAVLAEQVDLLNAEE